MKFDEALEMCEQEYERELFTTQKELSGKLSQEKGISAEIQNNLDTAVQEKDKLSKRLEENQEWKDKEEIERNQLHQREKDQSEKLKNMHEKLIQHESTIEKKEEDIKNLTNAKTHLLNFKFVLGHKIQSLKEEKVPMEQYITKLEVYHIYIYIYIESKRRDVR